MSDASATHVSIFNINPKFPDYITAAFYGFGLSIIIKPIKYLSVIQLLIVLGLLFFMACDGSIKFVIRQDISKGLNEKSLRKKLFFRLLLLMAEVGGLLCFAAWGAYAIAVNQDPSEQNFSMGYKVLGLYFLFCSLFNIIYLPGTIQPQPSMRCIYRIFYGWWFYIKCTIIADATQITGIQKSNWFVLLKMLEEKICIKMRKSHNYFTGGLHAHHATCVHMITHLLMQFIGGHFVWYNAVFGITLLKPEWLKKNLSYTTECLRIPTWLHFVQPETLLWCFLAIFFILTLFFYYLTSICEIEYGVIDDGIRITSPQHDVISWEGFFQLMGNVFLVFTVITGVLIAGHNAPIVVFGLCVQFLVMLFAIISETMVYHVPSGITERVQ